MSSATYLIFALSILFISTTMGHSQMRCAKYDMSTGNCYAPIRNANVSFQEEDNDMTDSGTVCQSPMTNPISAAYANGAGCPDYAPCPAPMGSFAQGETFTIMWLARNHAESDETPGNIQLFLSPTESMTQGDNADFSASVLGQQSICEAPFMSCDGQNGNFVQCYATCTMPANAPVGIHTLWWEWVWDEPASYNIYTTCADVYVTASGSSVSTPSTSTSSTTGSKSSTSTSTTASKASTSTSTSTTTGPKIATSTSTTGSKAATSTSSSTGSKIATGTKTSTSGKASTSTSTSTTGKSSTSTSSTSSSSSSSSSSGSNCAAVSTLSSSIGSLSVSSSWAGSVQFVLDLQVTESVLANWVIEVIWPTIGAVSVTDVYNAGTLQCQTVSNSGSRAFFKPVATWANNLIAGTVAPIEFIVSTNLDASTIMKTTQVLVYKQ